MILRYNLKRKEFPFTWDFATFLVKAKAAGATGIDFPLLRAQSTKWGMDESLKRFWNYMEPMPRLFYDMTSSIDKGGLDIGLDVRMTNLPVNFERMRLPDVNVQNRGHFTVTLRNTFHKPHKNSDASVWRKFAARIGAIVVEDSQDRPISLLDRYALYAGARMNYGVPNGPVSTLWYTDYPMTMFADPGIKKSWGGHSIKVGDRMSWLRGNQQVIWEAATVPRLLEEHEANFFHGRMSDA